MPVSPAVLRNFLLSAGLIAVTLLAYWPSVAVLWGFWVNPNYGGSHGLLVAALSVWLLFRARHELTGVAVRPCLAAGAVLLLASVAWIIFYRAGIQTLHVLLLPILMGLAVYAALGFRAALAVAFPLAFLYFATSAWGIFVGPLQSLTTSAVGVLAPLLGIPVRMQGDIVQLPGIGSFAIERGCSGVNFLATGLAVAALLGEIERASLPRRALLLAVMAVIAVLSNWIRVLLIIDAGYATNMRHVLVSRGHLMFGWVLFTTVMVAFVWLFLRSAVEVPESVDRAGPDSGHGMRRQVPTYLATMTVLVAMPVVVYTFLTRLDADVVPVAFSAPVGKAQWRGPVGAAAPAWQPEFIGAHSQWYLAYQDTSGHTVEMVAIGYPEQGQGHKLVSEENSLLGAGSPGPVAENRVTLDGMPYIELITPDAYGHRWLVWSIYDIGGRKFVTPLWSQLWYGMRSLGGAPYSVQFAFRAACEASCDSARVTLGSFLRAMGPELFASVGRESRSGPTLGQL